MKKKFSNNSLAVVLVIAIIFSVLITWNTLQTIEDPLTGMASVLKGTANVTISREIAISFAVSNVSFTDATTGQSRDSYASAQVNNCGTDGICGLNITNDGSVTVNITLQTTKDMFSGTSPIFYCNISNNGGGAVYYGPTIEMTSVGNASMQDCLSTASGGDGIENFVANLSYVDPIDWVMIDFKITVPADEPAGLKFATIQLTAVDADTTS